MTIAEYLSAVLQSQELPEDSPEWKLLIARRKEVEAVLRRGFPDSSPTIRYGGSRAKGTLIRECYDLDIACYFENGDTAPGQSLEEIYNNVAAVLGKDYAVILKTSALRIRDRQLIDFHIDVVPGRFTDNSRSDCFLHQNSGDKERLKTNLDVHIAHVRDSGVLPAIRLLKLWKVRRGLLIRQFPYELLAIDFLKGHHSKALADQVSHVWTQIRDTEQLPCVQDPANPTGNDLSPVLKECWGELREEACVALIQVANDGWEAVFGKVGSGADRAGGLAAAVVAVSRPTKPWAK